MFVDPAMVLATIIGSGIWAFIFTGAWIIASICFISSDFVKTCFVIFFVYLSALEWFTPLHPFAFITENPLEILRLFGAYVLFGCAYSVIKYRSFLSNMIEKIRNVKFCFCQEEKLDIKLTDPIPLDKLGLWTTFLKNSDYVLWNEYKKGFTPGSRKELIIGWIMFWPFSSIGLFVADPLRYIFTTAYNMMCEIYQWFFTKMISKKIHMSDIGL